MVVDDKGKFIKSVVSTTTYPECNNVHTIKLGNQYEIYKRNIENVGIRDMYHFYFKGNWVMSVSLDYNFDTYFTNVREIRENKINNLL